jgi:XTP/dITP diphosphohydrolase
MEIYFATGNKNKVKEFEEILKIPLKSVNLELPEPQTLNPKEVVAFKAKRAFEIIKKPVIVEDTGLHFKVWNGLPGALIKVFSRALGYKKLCELLGKERRAKAQTVIGYFDGKEYRTFFGELKGKIALSPKGSNNFGWDVIFVPENSSKTLAEMTPEEKNKISMRKKAIDKLKKFLTENKIA